MGSEHGPVGGDHRDLAVVLPEREGFAFLERDLEPARIELAHRRLRDPGHAFEAAAGSVDIEEQQRGAHSHSGGGEDLLLGELPVAAERDRGDAEAGRIAGGVACVLERIDDRRDMVALESPVAGAHQNQQGGRGDAGAFRLQAGQQHRDAVHPAAEPGGAAFEPLMQCAGEGADGRTPGHACCGAHA